MSTSPNAASSGGIIEPPGTAGDTSIEGAVCRVAHVGYPEGATIPADACGHNDCRCDASGELTDCGALLLPCEFAGNGPIKSCREMFPDGEVPSDAVTIGDAFILGSTLKLTVAHSGGCARHDYAVCFDRDGEPPYRYTLEFVHDAHEDGCEAWVEQTLDFDLTPLGQYSMDWAGEAGGTIHTQYGVYTFGELTCGERDDAARVAVAEALEGIDRRCTSDDECASTRLTADCTEECNALSRADQSSALDRLRDVLAAGPCDGFLEQGCTPNVPACEPRAAVCREGTCVLTDP